MSDPTTTAPVECCRGPVVPTVDPPVRCGCARCGDSADSAKCFCSEAVCIDEGVCESHGQCGVCRAGRRRRGIEAEAA